MLRRFRVLDLFAGPGGLAEGFSSVFDKHGHRLYDIKLSAEKEPSAHHTLTLRAFTRQFARDQLPPSYYAFLRGDISLNELTNLRPSEWAAAKKEALLIELGTKNGNQLLDTRIDELLLEGSSDDIIVIGGPPCQAYSLVGRARNKGIDGYVAEDDTRHFLYREYIRILDRISPAAFVMENVKGMLSSSVSGKRIFAQVRSDLETAGSHGSGYRLIALSPRSETATELGGNYEDQDFLVRSEEHGVPQARHRVIIVGIRSDLFGNIRSPLPAKLLAPKPAGIHTVRDVISDLPPLRSGLSRADSEEGWFGKAMEGLDLVISATIDEPKGTPLSKVLDVAAQSKKDFSSRNIVLPRTDKTPIPPIASKDDLSEFLSDEKLDCLTCHESRGHMPSDLARYFFCSAFSLANGRSPKAVEFPDVLAPDHKNWTSGKFADRFRVQSWDKPSTTIVSHIAKDGHYFVHPDPLQCRSLTVREAARLQTFPDNYMFLGNRTEQFVQVGNAVPPFLAMQIGKTLHSLLTGIEQGDGAQLRLDLSG